MSVEMNMTRLLRSSREVRVVRSIALSAQSMRWRLVVATAESRSSVTGWKWAMANSTAAHIVQASMESINWRIALERTPGHKKITAGNGVFLLLEGWPGQRPPVTGLARNGPFLAEGLRTTA